MKNLKIWLSSLLHQSSRSSYSAGNNVRTILRMGWNFYCCVGQVFLRHILLWLRVRTPFRGPSFWPFGSRSLIFSWLVGCRIWSHNPPCCCCGSALPASAWAAESAPLSENLGGKKTKKICLAGVELMCKIALLAHWWICFCRMDS